MPLDTNFNVSPYFDDYNEAKNYHRILFRPGVALQARELTQLQTILQNQVERFGDNIFKTGTIIKGCSLTTDYNYDYIKVRDTQNDGQPVNLNLYANALIVQESANLEAYVVNSKQGFESTDPNLNTLYIKYQNTGTGGEKAYANAQTVKVFNRLRTVEDITIINGGTLYNNSDVVVISGGGGSGATATLTTDSTGEIIDVSVTSKGINYTTIPTVTVTTQTGSSANLAAVNYIAELTIANSSFTAPVGIGTAVKTTEGIVYQKGHFIRVDSQEEVIEKYSNQPNNVVVGFITDESVINSNSDSTLLDIATGTPNFAAPGANRVKLSPRLLPLTKSEAAANGDFLALLEYENGNVVKDRTRPQFNYIGKELSKRTFEESGNYVLNTIPLNTADRPANTTHFDLVVGAGTAYVTGERIELLNNVRVPVRRGTDSANSINQTINTLYGSYVIVKDMLGTFSIKEGAQIFLRDVAATDLTDNFGGAATNPGAPIGTARIRSIEYDSGIPGTPSCQYRIYLFEVKMASGKSFQSVRSISETGVAVADVVLTSTGRAELRDIENDILVFNTGTFAVKELTQEEFIFRSSTNAAFTSGGSVTISFSGGNTLPYGTGDLSDSAVNEFIIIPTQTFYFTANNTGTVTANTNQTNVVGTSTSFTTDYQVGDYISIGNSSPNRIVNIFNDTLLQLSANFTGLGGTSNAASNDHFTSFPANAPIDFTRGSRNITINSSTSITIDLGQTIDTGANFVMYHDVENFEPAVRAKTLNNPVYVKLSTNRLKESLTGPWCLGIPDVLSIEAVYIGSSNTYSESSTNYAEQFELDNGQRDNYYGLAYLKRAPGSTITLGSNDNLLVKVKCFTHGSGKYISTESYPIDDTTFPLPTNNIRTEQIPVYVSPASGEAYSLRDAVDFRPIVSNTAVLSSTAAAASTDPPTTETFTAGEKFFPSASRQFECDIESYLSRIDRIVVGQDGQISIIEGVPSTRPSAPQTQKGTMDLGIIDIAPFPSLSSKASSTANRPDLKNVISLLQTRRYTMKDISDIENRIQRLEYYTLLSTLEANTKNLTIPSDANSQIEVFKNGFFVDPFNSYQVSNLDDGEYKAFIDTNRSRLAPQQEIFNIDLQFSNTTSTNVQKTGDLITLGYTERELISQPRANKERTLVEQNWSFAGKMTVIPRIDNFFDTDITATSSIDINIADPLNALIDAQNQINRQLSSSTQLISRANVGGPTVVSTTSGRNWQRTTFSQDIATTFRDTATQITTTAPVVSSQVELGNFLTSINITPFIRAQRIAIYASGLRPGASHFLFFDSVDLTNECTPCLLQVFDNPTLSNFQPLFRKGSSPSLTANSTGEIAITVDLPADTFTTGEKEFLLMDTNSLASEESATSKAKGKFAAFALQGQSTTLTLSTRNFDLSEGGFIANTFSRTRVVNSSVSWTQTRTWDPLSQTFIIQKQKGGDILYLTSIDVYFKNKDESKGVTLELREVNESGYPTPEVLPFSKVYKKSSQILTSNTAATPTTFTFGSPVAVKTEKEYAIVLTPDANSPDYRVWTSIPGLPDVSNTSIVANESWGLGTLFFSTSNRAFSPVQNEDLKFTVKRAEFSPTSGTVKLNNADYEFLTVNVASGVFSGGEDAAQMQPSYLTPTITTNTTSYVIQTSSSLTSSLSPGDNILIIYGTGQTLATANVKTVGTAVSNAGSTTTNFSSEFSRGAFIRIGNEVRQVINVASATSMTIDSPLNTTALNEAHYTVTPAFDVLRVESANSSSITVNRPPNSVVNNSIAASLQRVVKGTVSYFNGGKNKLYLKESNSSNSVFRIRTSNSTYLGYIVGDTSDAMASVTSIDDIPGTIFTPLINSLIVPGTSVNFDATFTKLAGGTDTQSYTLGGRNVVKFNDSAIVKSKSNEISGSTLTKSFTASLAYSSAFADTSPVIDINPSSIIVSKFNINNDSSNENTRYGNAQSKYVSKRLILNDGLDAEDIKVYVRAFRPAGTDVEVYAKILNTSDGESFESKTWSQLQLTTSSSLFSSSLNDNDIKEYEYTFKNTPSSTVLPGKVTSYSNTTIDGQNVTWTATFNANSGVNATADFISIASNTFRNGDTLTYSVSTGNTALSALVANKSYHVVFSNTSGVKLAATRGGSVIDLAKGATESGHNLSLLFPGDLVKIVKSSATTDYDILPVSSVTDSNTIVLSSNVTFSGSGFSIEKVDNPGEAFKYCRNNFIVRYFDNVKGAHDTYKYMAIKIVLKSQYSYLVPQVDDIRAIAISV